MLDMSCSKSLVVLAAFVFTIGLAAETEAVITPTTLFQTDKYIDALAVTPSGKLFAAAWDEHGSIDLWQSDGTPAGSSVIASAYYGSEVEPWPEMIPFGEDHVVLGVLLNDYSTWSDSYELWISDGTTAGTEVFFSSPGMFVAMLEFNGNLIVSEPGTSASPVSQTRVFSFDGQQMLAIPEPASIGLLLLSAVVVGAQRRKKPTR